MVGALIAEEIAAATVSDKIDADLRAGRFSSAQAEARQLVHADPRNPIGWTYLGMAEVCLGHPEEATAGSGDLVELLIARGHPVDIRDPAYDATPLGYALYDCLVEKRHPEGQFARVAKALLEAGSPLKGVEYPTGDEAVDEVLHAYI